MNYKTKSALAILAAILIIAYQLSTKQKVDPSCIPIALIFTLLPQIIYPNSIISNMIPILAKPIHILCNLGKLKKTKIDDNIIKYLLIPVAILGYYIYSKYNFLIYGFFTYIVSAPVDLLKFEKDSEQDNKVSIMVWILNILVILGVIINERKGAI